MMFPGQGSQRLGMMKTYYDDYSIVRELFAQTSDILGVDAWDVCQHDQDTLNKTEFAQPLLLLSSYAIWQIWLLNNLPTPSIFAGHSLGEYSALVCAGSLDFADAIQLVHKRGQFMQQAVPLGEGSMAAIIGLPDELVEQLCSQFADSEVVTPANYNAPGQVVIAGNKAPVKRVCDAAKEQCARMTIELAVSAPSHCALMKPAAEKLADEIKQLSFQSPEIPVVNNVTAKIQNTPEAIQQALVEQLYSPVQWVKSMQVMYNQANVFVECGAGKVLCGLGKRIDKRCTYLNLDQAETIESVQGVIVND